MEQDFWFQSFVLIFLVGVLRAIILAQVATEMVWHRGSDPSHTDLLLFLCPSLSLLPTFSGCAHYFSQSSTDEFCCIFSNRFVPANQD